MRSQIVPERSVYRGVIPVMRLMKSSSTCIADYMLRGSWNAATFQGLFPLLLMGLCTWDEIGL